MKSNIKPNLRIIAPRKDHYRLKNLTKICFPLLGLFMISVGPGVVTSIVGNLKGGGHLIHPTVWTVQVLVSFLKFCLLFLNPAYFS